MSEDGAGRRVVVVTGAGRGIGRALAVGLAGSDVTVVVSARTEGDLVETCRQVADVGGVGVHVVADAATQAGAEEPVRAALERFGRIDVLINNVGGRVDADHDPLTCSPDVVSRELELNLMPAWYAARRALPAMVERGHGRIVNIGSGASRFSGSRVGYTVAKHGVVGLTLSLAAAVATNGVTVNCLCPGWTDTGMHDWDEMAVAAGRSVSQMQKLAQGQSLQRRILDPSELVGMARLLASEDDGRGITGQTIHVDGGFRI